MWQKYIIPASIEEAIKSACLKTLEKQESLPEVLISSWRSREDNGKM